MLTFVAAGRFLPRLSGTIRLLSHVSESSGISVLIWKEKPQNGVKLTSKKKSKWFFCGLFSVEGEEKRLIKLGRTAMPTLRLRYRPNNVQRGP